MLRLIAACALALLARFYIFLHVMFLRILLLYVIFIAEGLRYIRLLDNVYNITMSLFRNMHLEVAYILN